MGERLRVGIVGAGSIGCYIGGKLLAANTADVVLVGRARVRDEIAAHGLTATDFDRPGVTVPAARVPFATELAAVADRDVVLVCVKSAQTRAVAAELADIVAADAVVVSLQNGVRNPGMLRAHLRGRRVIAGIISFNVVSRGEGVFHRGLDGPVLLEAVDELKPLALVGALAGAGVDVELRTDLAPDQWTKLVVNLNNAVSALSGAPTRDLLLSPGYRRVVAAVIAESIRVLRAAEIPTARLRGLPVGVMPHVLRLPTPLVRLVTRAQMKVDAESRSSMWEDLTRGRPTEVDFLNGEIVQLAERAGTTAPLNQRIVDLVHAAERDGPGSPNLSADALWAALHPGASGNV